MQSFNLSGENGSGLATIGLRRRADGQAEIKAVSTEFEGEAPYPRRAGMGGMRYLRNCLEAALRNDGGTWMPDRMLAAGELLALIDGGLVVSVKAERWIYTGGEDDHPVKLVSEKPWRMTPSQAFEDAPQSDLSDDWRYLFEQGVEISREQCERQVLREVWDTYAATAVGNRTAPPGLAITSLLGRQALLERQFLVAAAEGDERAWPLFHDLVSARYVRTLCLLHRCERTKWQQEILWPDISELGRTILLLSCCGWLKEAGELTHRARHMILSHQNQFVPLVPWFGIVWGTQNPEILAKGAVPKFHQETYEDMDWVLRNWQSDDLDQLAARLARISDRRRWTMGQFDDEYHIDFDDGFSWTIPYETGAVLMARKAQGLTVPEIEHPIFDLPTAMFHLAQGLATQHQDVYARFIRET